MMSLHSTVLLMDTELFFLISAYASILGLVLLDFSKLTEWQWAVVIVATVGFGWLLFSIWKKNRPRIYSAEKVNDYMLSWISQEGTIAISSHDMTWASEDGKIRDVLLNKSRKKELILCLPKQIEISLELQKAGASVYTYEKLGIVPESRFTIINFGRTDATVAIGRRLKDGKREIEEIANGEHPAFAVANDLISVIKALNEHA